MHNCITASQHSRITIGNISHLTLRTHLTSPANLPKLSLLAPHALLRSLHHYRLLITQELSEFFTLSHNLPLEQIVPIQPLFPPLNKRDRDKAGIKGAEDEEEEDDEDDWSITARDEEEDFVPLLSGSMTLSAASAPASPVTPGRGAGSGHARGMSGQSGTSVSPGSGDGDGDGEDDNTLAESNEHGQVTVSIHGHAQTMPASQVAELRQKVVDLASCVPDSSLVGGKTFAQLTLYEKKSVLINNELE